MPGTFVFKPIEATLDYKPSVGLHPENLDPYCKVKVGNVALSTHPSRNHGIHPHWDDNLVVQQGEDSSCTVTVKDKNKGTLGEVKLDLDEIEARGKVAKWFDIKKDRKVQGQLMMEVVYTSANPQSRSWHLSAKEGAALAGDHVRVKEHASPSEIGPFRVYERLRIPSKKCSHNGHMTTEELVEARKHIGNNALARYVADHMSPLDHTLVKHEIADHNARVLNSSHTQRSGVIVRDEPPLHKVEPVTVRDKVEVQAHVAGNGKGRPSTGGRSSTGVRPSNWNYTNAKDAVDVARHLGSERKVVYDDGYVRMKGIPVTGESKVSHATPLETAEAKQHMGNPILKNKTVKIMEPVTNQDVSDVVRHVGNISPSGQEGAVVTGHTDDYYVKKQYVNSPVVENYVSQSGNAHAGHSHLVNAKPRVQRDGTVIIESPGYVAPVVVESHVEGDQPGYAHAGHAGLVNARPRVERGGALIVGNPGYVAPVVVRDHVEVSQPGNAHAGHSSLQHGRVRVERDAALVHLPQQGIVPGSNWINNVVERESVASSCVSSCASCSSCTSAWEGMSNPNNAGKSREYLRGLDRVNMLNEKEKELSCDSCSVRSDLSDLKKRDYWYLNNIGMSDPNTAKLGVNHSKDRCGLVDQKHHHHHHHHHHGHHHGHHRGMRDRVVYETPTLADINTIGGNGVVYRKH